MNEVVDTLSEIVGRKLEVKRASLPADDPLRRRPDLTRATERLNWTPQTSLLDGLRATVEYFRSTLATA